MEPHPAFRKSRYQMMRDRLAAEKPPLPVGEHGTPPNSDSPAVHVIPRSQAPAWKRVVAKLRLGVRRPGGVPDAKPELRSRASPSRSLGTRGVKRSPRRGSPRRLTAARWSPPGGTRTRDHGLIRPTL